MNNKLKQSILTSYLLGAPIGILTMFATIYVPLLITGEGLLTLMIIGTYRFSIIGLGIAFIISLWFGGKLVFKNISKGKSLLLTSFKYSVFVNFIIWSTFCIIIFFTDEKEPLFHVIPPIIAFFLCTVITTFTLGLLIAYAIKRIYLEK